jgi:D-alanyl-D-alanine carboxypeptidase/D-alanyl-D-alanine-endopeptidase (penicillin-binding protein 4)
MKRLSLLVVVPWLSWLSPARAGLDADIRAQLNDKLLERAQVGIVVCQLGPAADKARVLFSLNADVPLIPASNMKVVTTSAALDRLGADFSFRTVLARRGDDFALVGDGDPSLGDHEMLKKHNWDVTTVFAQWAQALKKRGVSSARNVLVDDSVFDEVFAHPRWDDRHLHHRYAAQVGGLNLNANAADFYLHATAPGQPVRYTLNPPTAYVGVTNRCVTNHQNVVSLTRSGGRNDVTLSGKSPGTNSEPLSIAIHDPPMYAGTVLAETLMAQGIKLTGKVLRDRTCRAALGAKAQDGTTVLAIHETPLARIIERANKDSMNMYAEALCKRTGFAATGQSGSWESGTQAAAAFLKRLGIAADQFVLDDGCGLSDRNRLSVGAILRILVHNHHSAHRQFFVDSLAVGGVDGTLEKRFEGSGLQGRVHAKTGFITGVSALSGYLKARDDRWYAFSILLNNVREGSNWKMKSIQEAIVKAIDQSAGKATTR